MKGLKIIKAEPSNAIDLYPLIKEAAKEQAFLDNPGDRQIKIYYFKGLLNEVSSGFHIWHLARRGRGYLGYVHGIVVPGRWVGEIETLVIDMVYVVKNRRKGGIGRKLIDEIVKEAESIGIKRVEFTCSDAQVEYWMKERKAAKLSNVMRFII